MLYMQSSDFVEQILIETGCKNPDAAVIARITDEALKETEYQLDINELQILKQFIFVFTTLEKIARAGQKGKDAGEVLKKQFLTDINKKGKSNGRNQSY